MTPPQHDARNIVLASPIADASWNKGHRCRKYDAQYGWKHQKRSGAESDSHGDATTERKEPTPRRSSDSRREEARHAGRPPLNVSTHSTLPPLPVCLPPRLPRTFPSRFKLYHGTSSTVPRWKEVSSTVSARRHKSRKGNSEDYPFKRSMHSKCILLS